MGRTATIKSEPGSLDDEDSDEVFCDPEPIRSTFIKGDRNGINIEEEENYDDDDDDDDNDEIIREIPVFLSPELSKQIQLVQYPLQKNRHSSQPTAARIKPRHCMMELDFDTPSNIQMNGLYAMPSRTYTSHTIPVSTHMALGRMLVTGGENDEQPPTLGFHLIPLSRITQMRPSFSHVDEAVASATATTDEELKRQSQIQADASTGRKSISFQKRESERQTLARKSSYDYKKVSEESEGWDSLEVYDEETLQAKLVMDRVECPRVHQHRNLFDPKILEKESCSDTTKTVDSKKGRTAAMNLKYINTLNYLPPREDFDKFDGGNDKAIEKNPSSGTISSNNEHEPNKLTKSVVTKLVRLMHLGIPIPFSLLRVQFSTDEVSDESLFVALGSCAVLVRGNFCLNSKLLSYPPAMTQARTFLLLLFHSIRIVHQTRVLNVFGPYETSHPNDKNTDDADKVTPEIIKFLLEQVGKKTIEGWVLKVEVSKGKRSLACTYARTITSYAHTIFFPFLLFCFITSG